MPAAVGGCSVAGTDHGAEVAESGLLWRPAVVDRHVPFGVVDVHVCAEAGSEGEDVGDLAGFDGGAELRRYFIAVDWCNSGGVEHWLDADLAAAAAEEFGELVEGDRVAVFGPDYCVAGA